MLWWGFLFRISRKAGFRFLPPRSAFFSFLGGCCLCWCQHRAVNTALLFCSVGGQPPVARYRPARYSKLHFLVREKVAAVTLGILCVAGLVYAGDLGVVYAGDLDVGKVQFLDCTPFVFGTCLYQCKLVGSSKTMGCGRTSTKNAQIRCQRSYWTLWQWCLGMSFWRYRENQKQKESEFVCKCM